MEGKNNFRLVLFLTIGLTAVTGGVIGKAGSVGMQGATLEMFDLVKYIGVLRTSFFLFSRELLGEPCWIWNETPDRWSTNGKQIDLTTLATCQLRCAHDGLCVAIDFNTATNPPCWIHTDGDDLKPENTQKINTSIQYKIFRHSCPVCWYELPNTRSLHGQQYGYHTLDACQSFCDESHICVAVDYDTTTDPPCWIHDSRKDLTPANTKEKIHSNQFQKFRFSRQNCPPAAPSLFSSVCWSAFPKRRSNGFTSRAQFSTVETCLLYCAYEVSCVAVDFDSSSKVKCLWHLHSNDLRLSNTVYASNVTQYQINRINNCEGWTIIQQRLDVKYNFNRNWTEYKIGFGGNSSDYWMGLDEISSITGSGKYRLRIDLYLPSQAAWFYAYYESFVVDPEANNFTLHVSGYSGDTGDVLNVRTKSGGTQWFQNGATFSTPDHDSSKSSCASKVYGGGWWFNDCYGCDLNSPYKPSMPVGLTGFDCSINGSFQEIRQSRMLILSTEATLPPTITLPPPITIPMTTATTTTVGLDSGLGPGVPDSTGWTAIQQRSGWDYDFRKDWAAYKAGFRDPHGKGYWLGLETVSNLTNSASCRLRIDLNVDVDVWVSAKYENFVVDPEKKNYMLHVNDYSGNTGDVLNIKSVPGDKGQLNANGQPFSTTDRDNSGNFCAEESGGDGWWFNDCYSCDLNTFSHQCVINGESKIVQQSRMLMQKK